MKRKLMAFALVFAMLASLSPAVAADEMSATPTVEEILSEYHQKAFEAQTRGETDAASTWSRRGGSAKTLEQETVDTLTNAGYEAYHVTADNYDTLEADLHTDFSEMGLNKDGSYIVVIHGEDPGETASANSRTPSPHPELDQEDTLGGSSFVHNHEGTLYTMRYVTITATDAHGELFTASRYMLSNIQYLEEIAGTLGEYALATAGEKIVEKLLEESVELIPYAGTICSVASLLVDVAGIVTQDPLTLIDPGTLVLSAGTAWTRSYIQVYNEVTGNWHTAQCSSYAVSEASFEAGYVYNSETNAPQLIGGIIHSSTVYSPYYNNTEQRRTRSAIAYLNGYTIYDRTGDIEFYFENPSSNDPTTSKIPLFVHEESHAYLLPSIEET